MLITRFNNGSYHITAEADEIKRPYFSNTIWTALMDNDFLLMDWSSWGNFGGAIELYNYYTGKMYYLSDAGIDKLKKGYTVILSPVPVDADARERVKYWEGV